MKSFDFPNMIKTNSAAILQDKKATENNFKFQSNETDTIESEQTYITSITPNVYVGGTLDVRYNNLIMALFKIK